MVQANVFNLNEWFRKGTQATELKWCSKKQMVRRASGEISDVVSSCDHRLDLWDVIVFAVQ